jgi:hypothetical protein
VCFPTLFRWSVNAFLLFQMAVETMFQLHMAADSDLITLKK